MKKGPMAFFNRTPLPWAQTTPQHIERATHEILIPPQFCDFAFMVLRDPVARLISEFRYRSQAHLGGARFRVDLGDGTKFTGTFDGWVDTVISMAKASPWACDNHIRPQVDFWRQDVRVFLFEEGLEQVFARIDDVTDTAPIDRFHENRGASVPVSMSVETRIRAESFYRADYVLIDQVRSVGPKPEGAVTVAKKAAQPGVPVTTSGPEI